MLRKQNSTGIDNGGPAIAIFLVLMTVITVYIFMAKMWWFPPAITNFGHEIDDQFSRTLLSPASSLCSLNSVWPGVFSLPRSRPEGDLLRGQQHNGDRLDAGDGGPVRRSWPVCAERLGPSAFHWRLPGRDSD